MELFELEKEKKIKELRKSRLEEMIKINRERAEGIKAINCSKVMIQSSPRPNTMIDTISEIDFAERELKLVEKELEVIDVNINKLYQVLNEYNDRDQQIYIEKKLWNWSNARISTKHEGISKWTINRIIKKVKN